MKNRAYCLLFPAKKDWVQARERPTRRFPLLGTGKPVGGKMGPCYGGHSPGSYSGIDSSATCSGQTLSACRYKFSNKKGLRNNEQRLLTRQMVSLLVSLTLLKEIKENRHKMHNEKHAENLVGLRIEMYYPFS